MGRDPVTKSAIYLDKPYMTSDELMTAEAYKAAKHKAWKAVNDFRKKEIDKSQVPPGTIEFRLKWLRDAREKQQVQAEKLGADYYDDFQEWGGPSGYIQGNFDGEKLLGIQSKEGCSTKSGDFQRAKLSLADCSRKHVISRSDPNGKYVLPTKERVVCKVRNWLQLQKMEHIYNRDCEISRKSRKLYRTSRWPWERAPPPQP
jgi:hypothetical protein